MKRLLCVLLTLIFLAGCSLSTIRAPKKTKAQPVREPAVKRSVKPALERVEQKEEILPLEKEEIK